MNLNVPDVAAVDATLAAIAPTMEPGFTRSLLADLDAVTRTGAEAGGRPRDDEPFAPAIGRSLSRPASVA